MARPASGVRFGPVLYALPSSAEEATAYQLHTTRPCDFLQCTTTTQIDDLAADGPATRRGDTKSSADAAEQYLIALSDSVSDHQIEFVPTSQLHLIPPMIAHFDFLRCDVGSTLQFMTGFIRLLILRCLNTWEFPVGMDRRNGFLCRQLQMLILELLGQIFSGTIVHWELI